MHPFGTSPTKVFERALWANQSLLLWETGFGWFTKPSHDVNIENSRYLSIQFEVFQSVFLHFIKKHTHN